MAAQIKQLKQKQTNKENANKVLRSIESYNYHQLLTSKNDVWIAFRNMCHEDNSVISNLTESSLTYLRAWS